MRTETKIGMNVLMFTALLAGGLAAGENPAVKANNSFAIDLYRQLAGDAAGANLFFSPYSMSSALGMAAEGARGETAKEMARVLRYPEGAGSSEVNAGFKNINDMLNRSANDPNAAKKRSELAELRAKLDTAKAATKQAFKSENWEEVSKLGRTEQGLVDKVNVLARQVDPFELNVANALWSEKTYSIEEAYVKAVNGYYGTGGTQAADFKGNAEGERTRINKWVEDKTRDRIKDLIPEGAVSDMTRLVLVNAIYFKGEWLEPFEESRTKKGDFLLADGGISKTKLMTASLVEKTRYGAFNADGSFFNTPREVPWNENKTTVARYPGRDGFAMAELPYKGKEISMVLIAPLRHDGIERIEQKLTADNLSLWISKLKEREVEVTLPRFKLETTYRLEKDLAEMGMKSAFTQPQEPGGADFTGIADPENVIDRLYISAAIHKAFLEVNEKGTEAAAASSLLMECGEAAVKMMPFIPEFKADRPFLLMIRHNTSGAILFMGRVMNPQRGT